MESGGQHAAKLLVCEHRCRVRLSRGGGGGRRAMRLQPPAYKSLANTQSTHDPAS